MTLDELIDALQELRDGPLAGRFEVRFDASWGRCEILSVTRNDAFASVTLSPLVPRSETGRGR